MRLLSALVLTTITLAAGAGAVAAEPDRDHARRLYDEGKRHYDAGEYDRAVVAWKASYAAFAAPRLLFNIGQAYRLAGDCPHALRFYARYRAAEPSPSNAAELEAALVLCKMARPATDDGDDPPLSLPPPSVETEVATAATTATPATAPAMPTTPTTTSHEARDVPPPRSSRLRLGGGIAMGGGAIAVAAGGYFALSARRLGRDVADGGGEWDAAAQARQADGQRAERTAIGLAAVGAVAMSAGAAMWWIGGRRADTPHVGVVLAPGHASLEVTCGF